MTETDAFFLAAAAEHVERRDGKEHACPLPTIKTLAEDNKRAEQSQHGTGGVDRTYDSDRRRSPKIISAPSRVSTGRVALTGPTIVIGRCLMA